MRKQSEAKKNKCENGENDKDESNEEDKNLTDKINKLKLECLNNEGDDISDFGSDYDSDDSLDLG